MRECYARKRLQLKRQQAQFWILINEANDPMPDETTKLLDAWIPKEAVHLYLYFAGNWNKQTQIEFYEKKKLNLHCNFVDVVQPNRKYLADRNDNIADQASKTSAVLPAQSTDPIIAKLTEQEVLQTFCLPDLQYYHYYLQDLSSLIVQHPQNCSADLAAFSHKTQFVFACSNYQHNIYIDGLPPLVSTHLAV